MSWLDFRIADGFLFLAKYIEPFLVQLPNQGSRYICLRSSICHDFLKLQAFDTIQDVSVLTMMKAEATLSYRSKINTNHISLVPFASNQSAILLPRKEVQSYCRSRRKAYLSLYQHIVVNLHKEINWGRLKIV